MRGQRDEDMLMWASRGTKGPDQWFLMRSVLKTMLKTSLILFLPLFIRYVWPWAKRDALQHDSYSCHKFSGNIVGFPTQRKNEVE